MAGPKPIETVHRGYRMRSRLEARWAIWLDHMGIEYAYEAQGYDLGNAGWYLPDFWLWEQECYVEIRPRNASLYDEKCEALSHFHDVILVVGDPWPGEYRAIMYSSHGGEIWGIDDEVLEFAVGRKQETELWLDGEGYVMIQLNSVSGPEKGASTASDKLKIAYQMARGARF